MANQLRGEAGFKADGKDYTIVFTIDAFCHLEDRLDQDIGEILQRCRKELKRLGFLRTLLWAGLREKHGDVDEEACGDLVAKVGVVAMGTLLATAMMQAMPPPKEAAKRTEGPRKPKAKATPAAADGTGAASSESGSS
jgi:hypothetical protein